MADPVDAKHPYYRAERRPFDLMIGTGSLKCHCLPQSQKSGRVHNSGTVGEWLGGV